MEAPARTAAWTASSSCPDQPRGPHTGQGRGRETRWGEGRRTERRQTHRDGWRGWATVAGRAKLSTRVRLLSPSAASRVSLPHLLHRMRTLAQAQARARPAPRRPGRVWALSAGSSSRISTAVSTCGRGDHGCFGGPRRGQGGSRVRPCAALTSASEPRVTSSSPKWPCCCR